MQNIKTGKYATDFLPGLYTSIRIDRNSKGGSKIVFIRGYYKKKDLPKLNVKHLKQHS